MNELTKTIVNALYNTPASYRITMLDMRSAFSGKAMGSCYEKDPTSILLDLCVADWQPYSNFKEIIAPALGYEALIPGLMGVRPLDRCNPMDLVTLEDPKETGMLSPVLNLEYRLTPVSFTVIILGPSEGGKEIVYTFHPGAPITPSTLSREAFNAAGLKNNIITVKQAQMLGFDYAKVRSRA